ncbi:MAG: hypothetical protein HND58_02840 [Planctomycetota bacterium]|nr:MAG: hypothetical protein HND58_02840 [Planctomycetota bacterium]
MGGLPDDRVSAEHRRTLAAANLGVLRDRGIDAAAVLDAAWPAWLERLDTHECFRTTDGNLVRRAPGDDLPHWTAFLTDSRSIAAQFCEQRLGGTDMFPPPLAIEGIDPPWLAEGAWHTLAPNRVGYAAPITLLQADPMEFLDGLSAADLCAVLADERVRVFVGPDASGRWLEDATDRLGEVTMGMAIATPGVRTRISPDAQTVTNRWGAAQAEALRETQARVSGTYAPRDRAWWEERYARAETGGDPLRVLIPTSRYSTFIRHASEDLAEAFCGLGCDARVVMEPENGRPTSVGQLRWADPFEPDLIVLANYFRRDAGLPFPEQVPWVCWIQDAMAHQFKAREFTDLDFVAGHLHTELRAQDGFPHDRAMPFPLIASERKFHPAPIDAARLERFACEIAYVSHQSETPGAFHERCVAEEPKPEVRRLLDTLRPRVEAEAADPLGESLYNRLRAARRGGRRADRRRDGRARRVPLPPLRPAAGRPCGAASDHRLGGIDLSSPRLAAAALRAGVGHAPRVRRVCLRRGLARRGPPRVLPSGGNPPARVGQHAGAPAGDGVRDVGRAARGKADDRRRARERGLCRARGRAARHALRDRQGHRRCLVPPERERAARGGSPAPRVARAGHAGGIPHRGQKDRGVPGAGPSVERRDSRGVALRRPAGDDRSN